LLASRTQLRPGWTETRRNFQPAGTASETRQRARYVLKNTIFFQGFSLTHSLQLFCPSHPFYRHHERFITSTTSIKKLSGSIRYKQWEDRFPRPRIVAPPERLLRPKPRAPSTRTPRTRLTTTS
jgi:hypothetical protein